MIRFIHILGGLLDDLISMRTKGSFDDGQQFS